MSEWKLPWDAACLCGQVKMRVNAPPAGTRSSACPAIAGGRFAGTTVTWNDFWSAWPPESTTRAVNACGPSCAAVGVHRSLGGGASEAPAGAVGSV